MKRAARLLTAEDHQTITQAVASAEAKTSAEIVPVFATESGRYDRAEDIVGLWMGVGGMSLVWALWPHPAPDNGDWGAVSPWWKLAALVAVLLAGFVGGALLAMRVGWLRRLFTPHRQMEEEVDGRAREVFFDRRVHHTAGSSGVLLYVSLFERIAAVIADEAVLEAVGPERPDEWCRQLTQRLAEQPPAAAVCETIKTIGEALQKALPRADDDVNELSDAVVVLD